MSPESLPVKLRQARGTMSLARAAERSGVSESRIRLYEEGKRHPYGKTLRRLADTYGVPAAELFGTVQASKRSDGASAASHSAPPRQRRRRRRAQAEATTAQAAIEVPVEVTEGQTVRVVIELIIRPKASTYGAEVVRHESTPSEPDPLVSAGRPEPEGIGGRPERAVRRQRVAAGSAPAGWESSSRSADAHNPLDDFKRAYSEFRRDKKV